MASVYMPPKQRGLILGEDERKGRRRKQARESGVEIQEKEHPNVSTDRKNNRSQSDKLSDAGTFHSNLSPSASCSSSPQPCFPLGYFFFHRSSRLPIRSLLNLKVTRKKGGEGGDLADKSTETKVNKCRWSACC